MSKRDFEALATEWGLVLKVADGQDREGIWQALDGFYRVARMSNPAFSSARFAEWVLDVAEGRRDVNGRKVKVSA
jgi:hypothetical protein